MEFRTKGKGKDRTIFPVSKSKTYRRHYREKPSFGTSTELHGDIKRIMKKDDSVEHGSRDFDVYKKRLSRDADSQFLKQYKKAEKRDDKLAKRQEKEFIKNAEEDEETRKIIYHEK